MYFIFLFHVPLGNQFSTVGVSVPYHIPYIMHTIYIISYHTIPYQRSIPYTIPYHTIVFYPLQAQQYYSVQKHSSKNLLQCRLNTFLLCTVVSFLNILHRYLGLQVWFETCSKSFVVELIPRSNYVISRSQRGWKDNDDVSTNRIIPTDSGHGLHLRQ